MMWKEWYENCVCKTGFRMIFSFKAVFNMVIGSSINYGKLIRRKNNLLQSDHKADIYCTNVPDYFREF